jgi:hypothetical protein
MVAACSPAGESFARPVNGIESLDLPPSLTAPVLSADRDEMIRGLCDWANRNALPFSDALVKQVYLSNVISPGGGAGATLVLDVFTQSTSNPRVLVLKVGPADIEKLPALSAFRRNVLENGIWKFEKVADDTCDTSADNNAVRTSFYDQTLCVRVDKLDRPPLEYTDADYRDLLFKSSVLPAGNYQEIQLRIATLHKGGKIRGRSISLEAYALKTNPKGTSVNCNPGVNPTAFQSNGVR